MTTSPFPGERKRQAELYRLGKKPDEPLGPLLGYDIDEQGNRTPFYAPAQTPPFVPGVSQGPLTEQQAFERTFEGRSLSQPATVGEVEQFRLAPQARPTPMRTPAFDPVAPGPAIVTTDPATMIGEKLKGLFTGIAGRVRANVVPERNIYGLKQREFAPSTTTESIGNLIGEFLVPKGPDWTNLTGEPRGFWESVGDVAYAVPSGSLLLGFASFESFIKAGLAARASGIPLAQASAAAQRAAARPPGAPPPARRRGLAPPE